MAQEPRATIKTYFETGDTPTQAQFENWLDSTLWYDDGAAIVALINDELDSTTWQAGGEGGGDITISGTPVADQVAKWTSGTAIGGIDIGTTSGTVAAGDHTHTAEDVTDLSGQFLTYLDTALANDDGGALTLSISGYLATENISGTTGYVAVFGASGNTVQNGYPVAATGSTLAGVASGEDVVATAEDYYSAHTMREITLTTGAGVYAPATHGLKCKVVAQAVNITVNISALPTNAQLELWCYNAATPVTFTITNPGGSAVVLEDNCAFADAEIANGKTKWIVEWVEGAPYVTLAGTFS